MPQAEGSPRTEGGSSYEEVEYLEEVEYEEVDEDMDEDAYLDGEDLGGDDADEASGDATETHKSESSTPEVKEKAVESNSVHSEDEDKEEENAAAGKSRATAETNSAASTPVKASTPGDVSLASTPATSAVPNPTKMETEGTEDADDSEYAEGAEDAEDTEEAEGAEDAEDAEEAESAEDAEDTQVPLSTLSPGSPAPEKTGAADVAHAKGDGAKTKAPALDMDMRSLEEQASKVAQEVQNAAKEQMAKLSATFTTALGGFGASSGSAAAGGGGGVMSGLSNWWSSLDPPAAPKNNEQADRVSASNKASSELQELFGLAAEENLVESFKSKLLQTYGCNHNSFTPAIQMAFQGTLYITDKHTCFSVEERGRKLPFKMEHTQIVKATRQRPARKGDLSDILRLDLSDGKFIALKDFDSGSALDSALALVEHLMEG